MTYNHNICHTLYDITLYSLFKSKNKEKRKTKTKIKIK